MNTPAIEADTLVEKYGQVTALDGLSFQVAPGNVLRLLGPHGSGKTTSVSMLSTALAPDSGRASVHGLEVAREPRAVREVIGFAGQFAAVDPTLTGRTSSCSDAAGIEGTMNQAANTAGLRKTRYRGIKKVELEHALAATAINLTRL